MSRSNRLGLYYSQKSWSDGTNLISTFSQRCMSNRSPIQCLFAYSITHHFFILIGSAGAARGSLSNFCGCMMPSLLKQQTKTFHVLQTHTLSACMHAYACVYAHAYACLYACVCMRVCTCVRLCVCMRVSACMHAHVCVYACISVCMRACICVCMCALPQ